MRTSAPATPNGANIVQEGSANRVSYLHPHLAVVTAGGNRFGIVLVRVAESTLISLMLVTKGADVAPQFD